MRSRLGWLALVLAVLAVGRPGSAMEVALSEVISDPQRFDGQRVTLRGIVKDLKVQASRKGTPYYTFHLSDGTKAVLVFSAGQPACGAGAAATVDGLIQLVKQAGRYTVSHVEAVSVACP